MFRKVKTRKAYIDIVQQIQRLVRRGKLKPGDKLPPERILVEQLGVSRAPVREAISALEILGLIESKGGKGNFVTGAPDPMAYNRQVSRLKKEPTPQELLEARKLIEPAIAELAAERATAKDIQRMEKILGAIKSALGRNEKTRARRFVTNLLVAKAEATHNSILVQIMDNLTRRGTGSLWANMAEKSFEQNDHAAKYVDEHSQILQAIKEQDGKTAGEVTATHLKRVEKELFDGSS